MLNNTCHLSCLGILILPSAFCTALSGQEQRRTRQTSLSCPGTTRLLEDSPLSRALPRPARVLCPSPSAILSAGTLEGKGGSPATSRSL